MSATDVLRRMLDERGVEWESKDVEGMMDASRFEAVEMDASRFVVSEPDSREKLEADAKRYIEHAADYAYEDVLWAGETFTLYDAIIELLDRQRAIDDSICDECSSDYYEMQEEHDQMIDGIAKLMRLKQPYTFDPGEPLENIETIGRYIDELTAELEKATNNLNSANEDFENARAELTAERDKLQAKLNYLKAHGVTISEPFCGGYEVYNEVMGERDELQAKVDELKELNEYNVLQYELASEDCDRLQAQVDELTQISESKRVSFADRIRFVDRIDELEASNKTLRELVVIQSKAVFDLASNLDNKDK